MRDTAHERGLSGPTQDALAVAVGADWRRPTWRAAAVAQGVDQARSQRRLRPGRRASEKFESESALVKGLRHAKWNRLDGVMLSRVRRKQR